MMYIDEAEIVSVNKPYEDGKKSKKLMVEHHDSSSCLKRVFEAYASVCL